jgi:hypothetical protein
MRRALPFLAIALTLPFVSAALSQGFAPAALWLSTNEAVAGQTIKVYSVLYNSSADDFEGDIDFAADAESIQTLHFKLSPGETKVVSADWTAIAGEHSFSAQLMNIPSGALAGPTVTNTVKIAVATSAPSVVNTYLNAANDLLASTSPGLASFASDVASTTESWRQAGADWLSKQLYDEQSIATSSASAAGAAEDGTVLGTSTYRGDTSAPKASIWSTMRHYVLNALYYIFSIRILFYIAVCVVLFVMYKIIRGIFTLRRPGD